MVHEEKEATLGSMLIGFLLAIVSWDSYRRGERWAWFAILSTNIVYVVFYYTIHVLIGYTAFIPHVMMLFVAIMVGLLLPVKEFFSSKISKA